MCGTVGLFAGCPGAETCVLALLKRQQPEGEDRDDYTSALSGWYERSAVRSAPKRTLTAADALGEMFSPQLVPICSHPVVQSKVPDAQRRATIQQAYRYLMYTTVLETCAVNDVTRDIMLGGSGVPVPREMRLDAFKIYTDEAYHAQFSFDLFTQICELTEEPPLDHRVPNFLTKLHEIKAGTDRKYWRPLDYAFVFCAETLITGALHEASADVAVASTIREVLDDHARDEGRHHAYFADFFTRMWAVLERDEREIVGMHLPTLIEVFTAPDMGSISQELRSYGLDEEETMQVRSEVYSPEVLTQHLQTSARHTLRYIREVDGDIVSANVQEQFEERGLGR